MATYISDADLLTALAAHLKLATVADIPVSAAALVTACNLNAYNEIRGRLLGRFFTPAQIDSWDRAAEFNRDIALFWMLVHAANLTADDLWVTKLDRRKELDDVAVAIGGVIILPGVSVFAAGRLSTDDQAVTMDTKW